MNSERKPYPRNLHLIGELPRRHWNGGIYVKVYLSVEAEHRLIGRADIPDDHVPVLEIPIYGFARVIRVRFAIGAISRLTAEGKMVVERAVLMSKGQIPALLPGWQPLAS
ncbi:MAG: hypothetical protein JWR10_2159 [Rubritepida sp.]|nr:hypothetical protein [Rubritepida sp.]